MGEEARKYKINVKKAGGNASKAAKKYQITLPTKWVRSMGITEEERDVILFFNGSQITIQKCPNTETQKDLSQEDA